MATYQKQWRAFGAIIRQRGQAFQVETHHNGRRKRQTFKTDVEAEAYAKRLAGELKEEGAAALAITGTARIDALRLLQAFPTRQAQDDVLRLRQALPTRQEQDDALRLLQAFPTRQAQDDVLRAAAMLAAKGEGYNLDVAAPSPLAEATRFWLLHHPRNGAMPTIEEALGAYLIHKKERRALTVKELRLKIGRLAHSFEGVPVGEITTGMIEEWLRANLETPFNRRKHLNLFRTFFGFVATKYKLQGNPADGVLLDIVARDEREVEGYSVDEARRIMAAAGASPHAPRIVPAFAIGLFAGLRPAEIQGLDWADVLFDTKRIRVAPQVAKKRRSRFVAMSDNLIEWLRPYIQERGPVSAPPMTHRRETARVLQAAGCTPIRDGLRHTFASFHYAAHNDAGWTSRELGHLGTDILFSHYRRLATPEEAAAFWKIKPLRLIEAGQ